MFRYQKRFGLIDPDYVWTATFTPHSIYRDYGNLHLLRKTIRKDIIHDSQATIPLLRTNGEYNRIDNYKTTQIENIIFKDLNKAYQEYLAELIILGEGGE